MIRGVGMDVVQIRRIRAGAERHAMFLRRILTPRELDESALRKEASAYCAGRWAAKEAISKALGCGIGGECAWQEIEILNDPATGRPHAELTGRALTRMRALAAEQIWISITHESEYAAATAILEGGSL